MKLTRKLTRRSGRGKTTVATLLSIDGTDADLRAVVEAWPGLDEPIRGAIVQLCRVKG